MEEQEIRRAGVCFSNLQSHRILITSVRTAIRFRRYFKRQLIFLELIDVLMSK